MFANVIIFVLLSIMYHILSKFDANCTTKCIVLEYVISRINPLRLYLHVSANIPLFIIQAEHIWMFSDIVTHALLHHTVISLSTGKAMCECLCTLSFSVFLSLTQTHKNPPTHTNTHPPSLTLPPTNTNQTTHTYQHTHYQNTTNTLTKQHTLTNMHTHTHTHPTTNIHPPTHTYQHQLTYTLQPTHPPTLMSILSGFILSNYTWKFNYLNFN